MHAPISKSLIIQQRIILNHHIPLIAGHDDEKGRESVVNLEPSASSRRCAS